MKIEPLVNNSRSSGKLTSVPIVIKIGEKVNSREKLSQRTARRLKGLAFRAVDS